MTALLTLRDHQTKRDDLLHQIIPGLEQDRRLGGDVWPSAKGSVERWLDLADQVASST